MKKIILIAVVILVGLCFIVGCGDLEQGSGKQGQPDVLPTPGAEGDSPEDLPGDLPEIVIENAAFKIFEPAPGAEIRDRIVVKGLARVWEATVQYEFEDGHFILDEGFVTATEGAPGWGNFEIIISLDKAVSGSARVNLYEESAKDGSRLNELIIPLTVKK